MHFHFRRRLREGDERANECKQKENAPVNYISVNIDRYLKYLRLKSFSGIELEGDGVINCNVPCPDAVAATAL